MRGDGYQRSHMDTYVIRNNLSIPEQSHNGTNFQVLQLSVDTFKKGSKVMPPIRAWIQLCILYIRLRIKNIMTIIYLTNSKASIKWCVFLRLCYIVYRIRRIIRHWFYQLLFKHHILLNLNFSFLEIKTLSSTSWCCIIYSDYGMKVAIID